MTYWTTQHFKALQKAWYERLQEGGFQDAEVMVGGELDLRQNACHPYRDNSEITRSCKEAYYQFVAQKVQETVFTSDVDHLILARHADGKRIKHICEELEGIGKSRTRGTIRFRIRVYEMKWGLKQYTPKQLNRKVS